MLRDKDIQRMRSAQAAALPNTCDRIRVEYKDDGIGGLLPDEQDVLASIPCRKAILGRPMDYLRGGVLAGATDKVITLPQGTDVVATDRLEVDDEVFEVVGFLSTGEWETALRCLCVIVR